ncbi:unnamed protein product [Gadus morhua 'NCC']
MEEVEEEQEVEEVEEQEVEVFSETETGCEELRLGERETQSEEEEEREEEEDKDAEIFSAWMSRYRAGEAEKGRAEEHEGGGAPGRDPPVDPRGVARRRSSLPCTVTLSAMQFYRLHSAAEPPVSAKVLLQRTSSRGLLLSSPGPPLTSDPVTSPPNAQRRSSYIPPEDAPGHQPAHRTHFRRRSIMSMGDADSLCLICHKEFSQGDDGIQELPCSHTFHKQCVDEWLPAAPPARSGWSRYCRLCSAAPPSVAAGRGAAAFAQQRSLTTVVGHCTAACAQQPLLPEVVGRVTASCAQQRTSVRGGWSRYCSLKAEVCSTC